MKFSLKLLALGTALAIATAGSTGALAVDKDQIIKDRQALMKQQGADMGAIKGFLDGKNDQAKAISAASDLIDTMRKIPDLFPPDTGGPNPDGKYTTKPEIWSDWNGFLAARDAASQKAEALLAAVKGGDKAAIQTAFGDLGKNGCGACHEKFREEIKK
jgi:cytochrome c556